MVRLHLSCGLDTTPEWVVYNEFVLTTANVCPFHVRVQEMLILYSLFARSPKSDPSGYLNTHLSILTQPPSLIIARRVEHCKESLPR